MCCTEQMPASVMKTTQSSNELSVCWAFAPNSDTFNGLLRNLRLSISIALCSLVKAVFASKSFDLLSRVSKSNFGSGSTSWVELGF